MNLLLPFSLFAVHGADARTDDFFLTMAVAFFVQGSLANALASALVPQLVHDRELHHLRGHLRWAAIAGVICALMAVGLTIKALSAGTMLLVALAVALMAIAGVVSSPAVSVLYADHRYGMPGLTWALRILPVAAYLTYRPDTPALYWLLIGIALADTVRAGILVALARERLSLNGAGTALDFPPAAKHLIFASAVAGFSPLVARWIVSLGEAGGVTVFEAADRLYASVASLATIGVGNVTLVYLARLTGTKEEDRGWRWILWTTAAWSLLWLALSVALWGVFPLGSDFFRGEPRAAIEEVRHTFLALALGIPGFIMTGALSRRLLVVGRSQSLTPIALAGLACSAASGWWMFYAFGPKGFGLALSAAQYLVVGLMYVALRKGYDRADTRPV